MTEPDFHHLKKTMIAEHLIARGISDSRVLAAFRQVPRERFVPQDKQKYSYNDHPLPIGQGQTISQPFIVALMTQALAVGQGERVLEIGTGSGYQAAILAYLGAEVYSVERHRVLAEGAGRLLQSLGYTIKMKVDDGTLGWQEHAPYDKIVITAAASDIPKPLLLQLRVGGTMVIPVGGTFNQDLTVVRKVTEKQIEKEIVCSCIFVPLVGKYGHKE